MSPRTLSCPETPSCPHFRAPAKPFLLQPSSSCSGLSSHTPTVLWVPECGDCHDWVLDSSLVPPHTRHEQISLPIDCPFPTSPRLTPVASSSQASGLALGLRRAAYQEPALGWLRNTLNAARPTPTMSSRPSPRPSSSLPSKPPPERSSAAQAGVQAGVCASPDPSVHPTPRCQFNTATATHVAHPATTPEKMKQRGVINTQKRQIRCEFIQLIQKKTRKKEGKDTKNK